MKATNRSNRIETAWLFLVPILLTMALVVSPAVPVFAADKQEATQLVEKARLTLDSFMSDNKMGAFRDLLKKADGVVIAPELLKGAFIVGASGGNAVFLTRDKKTGKWSDPAFYTIGGGSFGLQIGGQASEVILLMMTDRGVTSLLGNSVKLGGDIGVAAGPVGMGAAAATANLSADILSFSRSKGLYGGVSLDGAVVAVRSGLNEAFYGKPVSPADILVRHDVKNPQAMALIEDLSRSAAQKSSAREEILPTSMAWDLYRG
jgi:lipid-binding SYLF domain-containing protein